MTKPIKDYPNFRFPNRHMSPENSQRQSGSVKYDLVVFSHLRWGHMFQRPQHIVKRLASTRRVLFVELPIACHEHDENTVNIIQVNENISLLQPRIKDISNIGPVLNKFLGKKNVPIGWFYSPAFSPVFNTITFDTVIYDCIDEPDAGTDEQESLLLSNARIVFTDGKSLYEEKQKVHTSVHYFPSSVEHLHFRKALNGIAVPDDIMHLKGTVIGYYGLIDDRIDFLLLDEIAALSPDASLVMIGPLSKISRKDLPKRENIHYLGMRPYEVLPNYLKGFDIAMMPFAINDATRYISPVKTLEYMAAGKPIISTPVSDVVRDYRNHINIVSDAKGFCDAKRSIMKQLQADAYNTEKYNDILQTTSWDDTVKLMEKLIANIPVSTK